MKELTLRQKQAINTRLKITDTAMTLFRLRGYDSVKVTDICKEANISVGNFYHYFESKEKIIENSYIQIELLIQAKLDFDDLDNYYDKIVRLFAISCSVLENDLGWKFVAQCYKQIVTADSQYTINPDRSTYKYLKRFVKEGLASGEFSNLYSEDFIVEACMRAGRGVVYDWCIRNGGYSLVDIIKMDISRNIKTFLA